MTRTPASPRALLMVAAIAAVPAGHRTFAESQGAESLPAPQSVAQAPRHNTPQRPEVKSEVSMTEQPDVSAASTGFANPSAFAAKGAVVTPATALTPPVTVSYSGTSSAVAVNATGTGKAVQATINNPKNSSSALYGQTNGSGAALTGYNGGTAGPAGKFGITNAASGQPAVSATTIGTGNAIVAVINNSGSTAAAAVFGQNPVGYGVYGEGGTGVWGHSTAGNGVGVYGDASSNSNAAVLGNNAGTGAGVQGISQYGIGVDAESTNSIAVRGMDYGGGIGVYGWTEQSGGYGVFGQTTNSKYAVFGEHDGAGAGVHGQSASGRGVSGESTNGVGVFGQDDGNGIGVYGNSLNGSGFAGYFTGNVAITGNLTVGTTVYSSDRNLKADFKPVDGEDLLERVSALPVSSWDFKADPAKRHVGPMAQDFHAAFGLNGDDETHINPVDLAGVSLVAIQELHKQVKDQAAEIAELRRRLSEQSSKMANMDAAIEAFAARMAREEGGRSGAMDPVGQVRDLRTASGTAN